MTITDDGDAGTITWPGASAEFYETNGTSTLHTITVLRTGRIAPSGDITVNFTTVAISASEGDDYTRTSGTLTFADNTTLQTIVVEVLHDVRAAEALALITCSPTPLFAPTPQDIFEYPDETFQVVLSDLRYNGQPAYSLRFGELAVLNVTIADDGDAGTLVFDSAHHQRMEVTSEAVNHTVTVTRTGRASPDGDISVRFMSQGVTATPTVDYLETAGTLHFGSNVSWATFVVTINDDMVYEARRPAAMVTPCTSCVLTRTFHSARTRHCFCCWRTCGT